jgi:hypothetical protein
MPNPSCKRCGQKTKDIGQPIDLNRGAKIQWIQCANSDCALFDALFSVEPGQEFTLNEIEGALNIKINYPTKIGD